MRYRWLRSGIAFLLLSFLLAAPPVPAAAPSQSAGWRVVGQIGGPTQAVAVQGQYAYVGIGLRLVVLDVTNPVTPTEMGATAPFPYFVEDIAVSGSRACVAAGGAGLRVIDVSDPAHPTEVGFYITPGSAYGVAVSGTYVYVAAESSLRVIDVSDPAHPTEVGFHSTPGYTWGVAVSGPYAYMASRFERLHVFDVSDPAHPTYLARYYAADPLGVAASGTYVYVADGGTGLRIYYTGRNAFVLGSTLRGNLTLPPNSDILSSTVSGSVSLDFASRVQNTTAGGSISLYNGTVAESRAGGGISISGSGIVQNNTVTGSITLGGGSVLTNTVAGGGISVAGSGTVQGNNVEGAPGWGISAGAGSTVAENRLVGNASGIQIASGTVRHNLIANTPGVGLQLGGSATAEHNTFTGIGGSAVKITGGTAITLTGNNFEFNPGAYDVEDLVPKTTLMTVNARNNWWGTTSSAVIQQRIWDFNDDYNLGTVLYSPVLTEPSALAPAYVRAITLTPESPVGIQTVAFDVLFSREMNPEVAPVLSFADYSGFYGGTWPAPNRYRALYDFNTSHLTLSAK
jgi:hypothetical protein